MTNPYASPNTLSNPPTPTHSNGIAIVGFFASLTGVLAMFAISAFTPVIATFATWVAFLNLPGLILSAVGLFGPRRRLAGWGLALGLLGTINLPTLIFTLTR